MLTACHSRRGHSHSQVAAGTCKASPQKQCLLQPAAFPHLARLLS